MIKNSFLLFTEITEVVELLTNEQKGMLFQAILDYQIGKEPDLSEPVVRVAFTPIKQNLDRNNEKWQREKEKRSEAGKKGMASRWKNNTTITDDNKGITNDNAVITPDNKGITKITVNDNVNDNVNVNDNKRIDYQGIINLYNTICVSFPKVTKLSDSRKRAIRARLKSYSVEDLKTAFQMAEESDFLSGRSGKWNASFDWLMNETNLVKVLDGNFKNKTSGKIEVDSNLRQFIANNQVVDFGM